MAGFSVLHGRPGIIPGCVGPAATYNGAALSGCGGAPLADNTAGGGQDRITAKPVAHWWQPGEQVVTAPTFTIGVAADAWGGIASVRFSGDCATTTVTTATVLTDTDASGGVRVRLGYWITLDCGAFLRVSPNGAPRFFATVTATDGTMQTRVIGADIIVVGPVNKQIDWHMTLYPRAGYDFDKTIGTGGDYADIVSFITAARTVSASCPRGTVITTGFYEATSIAGNTGTTNATGCMVITHAPGVVATIGRATPFDPNATGNAADWRPGWHGIEFRGSGIVFDTLNWNRIQSTKPCWFNGCKITTSLASPATTYAVYWNKGQKPQGGVITDVSAVLPSWLTDCTVEYQTGWTNIQMMATGCKVRYIALSPFDKVDWVANTFLTNCDISAFNSVNALTINYSGTGAAALVNFSGLSGDPIILSVDGVTVASFTTVTTPGAADATHTYAISDLVTKINAISASWTAALTANADADTIGSRQLGNVFPAAAPGITNVSVFHTTTTFATSMGIHTEAYHSNSNTSVRENIHWWNNWMPNNKWSTAVYDFEWSVNDAMLRGTIAQCNDGQTFTLFGFSQAASNCNFVENQIDEGVLKSGAAVCDAYCHVARNILKSYGLINGATEAALPAYTDNLIGGTKLPAGANDSANTQITALQYQGTWTTYAAGADPRPAGAAASLTLAPVNPLDARYEARATPDAPGPLKISGSAMGVAWPVKNFPWAA